MVTLYNKVSFVNVLTNNEQYIYYTIYSSLLTLVSKNTIIHCFMLAHSALTNINKHSLWF